MTVNPFLNLAVLFLFLIFIYASMFHSAVKGFFYRNKKFKCLRCGHCCRLKLRLYPDDIKRLKKAGYKNFLEDKKYMKRINGYCMFLTLDNGKAACKLEHVKPKICRTFPKTTWFKIPVVDTRCSFYNKKYLSRH